jgi:hypothetical protein
VYFIRLKFSSHTLINRFVMYTGKLEINLSCTMLLFSFVNCLLKVFVLYYLVNNRKLHYFQVAVVAIFPLHV